MLIIILKFQELLIYSLLNKHFATLICCLFTNKPHFPHGHHHHLQQLCLLAIRNPWSQQVLKNVFEIFGNLLELFGLHPRHFQLNTPAIGLTTPFLIKKDKLLSSRSQRSLKPRRRRTPRIKNKTRLHAHSIDLLKSRQPLKNDLLL